MIKSPSQNETKQIILAQEIELTTFPGESESQQIQDRVRSSPTIFSPDEYCSRD
jgi:hypothetical protein